MSGAKRRKARPPRGRLTHLEVRRDKKSLLKITVTDSALATIGNELGALIAKISPGSQSGTLEPESTDLIISPQHADDDEPYHAALRDHLTGLFSMLCDASLSDALAIAQREQTRRMIGSN